MPSPRKVIIIGGRATTKYLRDYTENWEVWALNAIRPEGVEWVLGNCGLTWSRCFNLHLYRHLKRDWKHGLAVEIAWAHLHPEVPFYVCDRWPHGALPNQILFPRKELELLPHGRYHAGSFDWLVPFALHLGMRQIDFHGVGLNLESGEPISARACLEYWCGYAEGRGCRVTFSPDSDPFAQYHLVKSHTIYGYDDVRLVEDHT